MGMSHEKRSPGRPKLAKGVKKENFYIRLNPEEAVFVEKTAEALGISKAAYIRQLIQQEMNDPL